MHTVHGTSTHGVDVAATILIRDLVRYKSTCYLLFFMNKN